MTVEVLDLVKVDEVCTSFFVEGESFVWFIASVECKQEVIRWSEI